VNQGEINNVAQKISSPCEFLIQSLLIKPDAYKNYTVSQKKHVTTFSTITLTIGIRLQNFWHS